MFAKRLWRLISSKLLVERKKSSLTTSISIDSSSSWSILSKSTNDDEKEFFSLSHFNKREEESVLKHGLELEESNSNSNETCLNLPITRVWSLRQMPKFSIYQGETKHLQRVTTTYTRILHAKKSPNFNKRIFVNNSDNSQQFFKRVYSFVA